MTDKDRVRPAFNKDKDVFTDRTAKSTLHDHSLPCCCQQRRSRPSKTAMDVLIVTGRDKNVTNSCRVGTVATSGGHALLYPGHRHPLVVRIFSLVASVRGTTARGAINISLVVTVLREVYHASTQA